MNLDTTFSKKVKFPAGTTIIQEGDEGGHSISFSKENAKSLNAIFR